MGTLKGGQIPCQVNIQLDRFWRFSLEATHTHCTIVSYSIASRRILAAGDTAEPSSEGPRDVIRIPRSFVKSIQAFTEVTDQDPSDKDICVSTEIGNWPSDNDEEEDESDNQDSDVDVDDIDATAEEQCSTLLKLSDIFCKFGNKLYRYSGDRFETIAEK